MKKRVLIGLIVVGIVLVVIICVTGNRSLENLTGEEGTFSGTELELDLGLAEDEEFSLMDMQVVDDRIHLLVYVDGPKNEVNDTKYKYCIVDLEGNILTESLIYDFIEKEALGRAELKKEPEGMIRSNGMSASVIFEDGQLAYAEMYDPKQGEDGGVVYTYDLVLCDVTGQETQRVKLLEDGSYGYVERIFHGAENQVFVLYKSRKYFDRVDLSSSTITRIDHNDLTEKTIYSYPFCIDSCPVIEQKKEQDTYVYQAVDLLSGTVKEEFSLLQVRPTKSRIAIEGEAFYAYTFPVFEGTNSGYDVVTSAKNSLFGLNFGEETYTLIMDYANTKLRDYELKDISFIDREHFVAMYNTYLIVFNKDDQVHTPSKTDNINEKPRFLWN